MSGFLKDRANGTAAPSLAGPTRLPPVESHGIPCQPRIRTGMLLLCMHLSLRLMEQESALPTFDL